MKVTDITPQKNNPLRVNVFIDNVYRFSLDAAEAVLKGIKIGKDLTNDEITNLLMDSEFSKARDYALGILSRKSITSHSLKQKLAEKGYDEIISNEVINELTDLGYIDDIAYANTFLEYCRDKMWGKKKIVFEMKNKGLNAEIIEVVLADYDDSSSLDAMADIIISKYGHQDITDIRTKAKITRYFASRGYDFSKTDAAIRLAIEEISNE